MAIVKDYYKNINTSMTDFDSFYQRMAEELPDNCRIAEVGVADGRSALMLADMLHSLGKNFHLTMVDNCDYGAKYQANVIWNHIVKSGYQCIDFLDMASLDASCKFNDNTFDFVFIDASHRYELTKADIRLWLPKVKYGGILAGHDYWCQENPEVKQAVDEIISVEDLRAETTDKGHGLWYTKKQYDQKIKINKKDGDIKLEITSHEENMNLLFKEIGDLYTSAVTEHPATYHHMLKQIIDIHEKI